jgi:VWFA-related protein
MNRFSPLVVFALLAPAFTTIGSAQTPTPFGAAIEVSRVLTEVRVEDSKGNPVSGLTPDDFRVFLDGVRAEVASVVWVPSTAATAASPSSPVPGTAKTPVPGPPVEGRTIVIMFQVDFGLHISRTVGIVRMAPRASEFVRSLGPGDRVALMTYGSHLQLHSDFTDDHEALAEMIDVQKILSPGGEPPRVSPPLLGDYLDPEAAKNAGDLSYALELIGRALGPLPGTKSLVFFGYGLGRMTAGASVTVGDGYEHAMAALTASRTSVFSLDITDADAHSLAHGLRTVSEDTGGFYVKTHLFPDTAMERLARVISSYYELEIIPPPDLGEDFKIRVKVDRPRVSVYTRQWNPSNYKF